jgi:hypothetical protein
MKKNIHHLVFGGLCAAMLVAGNTVNAQTTTKPKAAGAAKESAETAKPKPDWYPFYGTVAAVDKSAKTVSLKKKEGERVLKTDAKTTLEQDGQPATLASIKPGYYLHGKLHKLENVEYILDAKIELEAPAKKGTNTVSKAKATAAEATTNAPAKPKKKAPNTP